MLHALPRAAQPAAARNRPARLQTAKPSPAAEDEWNEF
jgi:hypothetical protein